MLSFSDDWVNRLSVFLWLWKIIEDQESLCHKQIQRKRKDKTKEHDAKDHTHERWLSPTPCAAMNQDTQRLQAWDKGSCNIPVYTSISSQRFSQVAPQECQKTAVFYPRKNLCMIAVSCRYTSVAIFEESQFCRSMYLVYIFFSMYAHRYVSSITMVLSLLWISSLWVKEKILKVHL